VTIEIQEWDGPEFVEEWGDCLEESVDLSAITRGWVITFWDFSGGEKCFAWISDRKEVDSRYSGPNF
jgi:hypothetical protein